MYYRYFKFAIAVLCLHSVVIQAQQIIDYKEVIDYYRPSVKSTILMRKDCTFLKDGFYTFKGTIEDFDLVVHNLLQIPSETDFFMPNDSLELSGAINDSVKVGVWNIKLMRDTQKNDFVYYYDKGKIKGVGINFEKEGNDGMCAKNINLGHHNFDAYYLQNTYTLPKDLKVYFNTYDLKTEHDNDYSFSIERADSLNNTIYRENSYGAIDSLYKGGKVTIEYLNKQGKLLDGYLSVREGKIENDIYYVSRVISIDQERNFLFATTYAMIKDHKLIKLEIEDNLEKYPFFREMLPVNYFPVIFYEKTKFWIK